MKRSHKDRTKGDKRDHRWTIPKAFKVCYKRRRRHQDNHCVRIGKEPEIHKKEDGWNYW